MIKIYLKNERDKNCRSSSHRIVQIFKKWSQRNPDRETASRRHARSSRDIKKTNQVIFQIASLSLVNSSKLNPDNLTTICAEISAFLDTSAAEIASKQTGIQKQISQIDQSMAKIDENIEKVQFF